MNRLINRIKKQYARLNKFNNGGFTLVEMIVSFMLIGLFMVAAGKVIANTASVYYEATGIADGMQVSSIISSKIRSELENAREFEVTLTADSTLGGMNGNIGYNKISFTDKTGTSVYISVNTDNYLVIHYDVGTDKNDWTFDKKTYMGYTIKELKFTQPKGDYNNNIIYMSLTLSSSKYGDYTVSEYIECYNFDKDTSVITASN